MRPLLLSVTIELGGWVRGVGREEEEGGGEGGVEGVRG